MANSARRLADLSAVKIPPEASPLRWLLVRKISLRHVYSWHFSRLARLASDSYGVKSHLSPGRLAHGFLPVMLCPFVKDTVLPMKTVVRSC